jgi:hypothetical protein
MIVAIEALAEYIAKKASITGDYGNAEMTWSMSISSCLIFVFGFLGVLFFVWHSYREGVTANDKTIVADSPQP